ncbi:ChaC-like protein [Saccharata proteae CBS 121410]|uniref:glutathione-specific gamma-glutamylcyclotransferase n=1 Tax=Saccharata proteae CBS 121410 TaxID=1314787 RepID=A0A9P4LXL0_9PEZI|nr:ChaC-like protein [Saccharata proteae CBS 121410]
MLKTSVQNDFWLFGYGSLIWKPPPHFDQRVPGYIEGYVRRFWQVYHRGTPEAPGRVATLIDRAHWETLTDHHSAPAEKVWGAAYHIPSEKVAEVRAYLDIREINGYSIQYTPFHPGAAAGPSSKPIHCLVYIGLPDNPQFLGPQDPQKLAEHIVRSRGPSGENKEYLYMLETALLELGPDSGDDHIFDLARRCRDVEAKRNVNRESTKEERDPGHRLHKVGSTEEQEEVEKT